MKVGFVGAGKMAGALARGWAAAEGGPEAILLHDLDPARAERLAAEVGGEARTSLAELATDSELLVLAVKPTALDDVARSLGGRAPALVSVVAATPLARLEMLFPGIPLLRAMPNQPVEVRRGVICHAPPANMDPELADRVLELLRVVGVVVELEDDQLDTAMALMSCSPAYVALFAEALAAPGGRHGLGSELGLRLVVEAISGTAELLRRRDPGQVRSAVTSPGGATEAGLKALDAGGFASLVDAAVEASLRRFR